jgi:hypothetical protein
MDLGGLGGLIGGGAGFLMGGPAGAAVGAQIGGGIDTNNSNAQSAAAAQQFSAQQYATRYQTQVSDMKAAGLNPMLSYMNAPPSSPTGVTSSYSNPYAGAGQTYGSTANLASSANLMDSQANAAIASAWQSQASTEYIYKQAQQITQSLEAGTPDKNADQLVALASELRSKAALNGSLDLTNQSQRQLNVAIIKKVFADTDVATQDGILKSLDVQAANSWGNAGRYTKEIMPFIDLIRMVLRR